MTLVTITIKAAYEDHQTGKQIEDYLSDRLVEYLLDGLQAEVAFTSQRTAEYVEYPDCTGDLNVPDEAIEAWQTTARELLGGL